MIGRIVSHYRVVEQLGEGGMGVVYKAQDLKLGRTVALKFLPPHLSAEAEEKRRFVREAQAASVLDHPNICTIYEIGHTAEGQMFISMAYCEGETLKKKIERGPLAPAQAIRIGVQIAEGLAKAHAQGIVHRDIKPANVMVTHDGVVKIVDFGLAKPAGITSITREGALLGTPAYMAPEQLEGRAEVDHRADIWALGVVLYEMLAGRPPFARAHERAVADAILREDPQPLKKFRTDLPGELERLVAKALVKNPQERCQQVGQLLAELRVLDKELASSTVTVPGLRPAPAIRGRRRLMGAAGALLVLLAALALLIEPVRRQFLAQACQWAPGWLAACALPAEKHMAMAPFQNLGVDPAGRAYGDGLVEALKSKLNRLASFQRSFCFHSVADAGETSGFALILTGSVKRQGDTVLFKARLLDLRSSLPLRQLTVEAGVKDLPLLQDGLAGQFARLLELELPPEARVALLAGGTAIPGAFDSYLEGLGYLSRNDPDNAAQRFEQALKQDPYYALAHAGLGNAKFRKFNLTRERRWMEEARESYKRALPAERSDKLASVHAGLGLIDLSAGRYREAVGALQRARALDPSNIGVASSLAAAYEALGSLPEAESAYRKAVELKPNCFARHSLLGLFYRKYGRYKEAEIELQEAARQAPDSPQAFTNLGALHLTTGRYAEAAQFLKSSIALQPTGSAYSNLGTAYYHQGCYADAARMMERAIEKGMNNYRMSGNLAETYLLVPELRDRASGAFRRAIELAERELSRSPTNAELLGMLAGYSARLGQKPQALAQIRQALAQAPKNVNVLFRVALAYEIIGERASALKWLGEAVKGGLPTSGEVRQAQALEALRMDPAYRKLDPGYQPIVKQACRQPD